MSPLRPDPTPSAFDIALFRIAALAVAGGLLFGGTRLVGRELHEREAHELRYKDRGLTGRDADRAAARELAQGFRDTKSFEEIRGTLPGEELNAATLTPHPVQQYAWVAAIVGAVLGLVTSAEGARVWARKRAAQRAMR